MIKNSEKKKTIFYLSLKELLSKRMPKIHQKIEKSILTKDYKDVIECVECCIEKPTWGQVTQWRIAVQVDRHPYDEIGRPYVFGGYVHLEEVQGRNSLDFKTQMYNSFDKSFTIQDTVKIHQDMLNDNEFVELIIEHTTEFLNQFHEKFMESADVFTQEWRVAKIKWDEEMDY
jgi:hypothetical protein